MIMYVTHKLFEDPCLWRASGWKLENLVGKLLAAWDADRQITQSLHQATFPLPCLTSSLYPLLFRLSVTISHSNLDYHYEALSLSHSYLL